MKKSTKFLAAFLFTTLVFASCSTLTDDLTEIESTDSIVMLNTGGGEGGKDMPPKDPE